MSDVPVSHIVGPLIVWHTEDGPIGRQRCTWCGALLDECEYSRMASLDGEPPGTWPVGEMMRVSGDFGSFSVRQIVEEEMSEINPDVAKAPDDACFRLDPAVTR